MDIPGTCVPEYPLGVAMRRRSFTAKTIFGLLLAVVMVAAFATAGAATPRSGELHVTKECSQNHGNPGDFCTITGSNVNVIRPGMKVIYIDGAGPFGMGDFGFNTDIVLDGPGNNDAYGHVVLSFLTGQPGVITFSGRDRPVPRVPRQRRRHLQRHVALGRNVQLHPARPRQLSGCATRSDPPPAWEGSARPKPRGSASARMSAAIEPVALCRRRDLPT